LKKGYQGLKGARDASLFIAAMAKTPFTFIIISGEGNHMNKLSRMLASKDTMAAASHRS
jgi:hypothetical protein